MDSSKHFGWVDYCMLAVVIVLSVLIGLFHSFKGNKTPEDYAMGSRNMKPWPVSLSLLASFLSANTILGLSGEIYAHGLEIIWCIPGTCLAIIFAAEVVFPVLYPLKLFSPNQYLELRFNSRALRILAMLMTSLSIYVFMGLALFAPTLALATVTPLSYESYIWIMGVAVTIYASLGGLRAVVWTDVFQMTTMTLGTLLVAVMASIEAGGITQAWQTATEGGRTYGLTMDPSARHTVWNVLLLTSVNWGSHYSVSQANYMRISAIPDMKMAKRVMYYNIVGMFIFLIIVSVMGVCVYAVYAGCDPYALGYIHSKDQIVVHFVVDKLAHLPGIPGIFVATLLSAALSSLSSGVNTMTTLIWADILSPLSWFKNLTEFQATTVNKIITFVLGFLFIGLAFLASMLGGLTQAGYQIVAVMAGPMLGIHLLGMLVPFANRIGAITGVLTAWGLALWIVMGSFLYGSPPEFLPISTDFCPESYNATYTVKFNSSANTTAVKENSGMMKMYNMSYTYIPAIGVLTCLVVGTVVSLLTGPQDPKKVPSKYLLHCVRRFGADATETDAELPEMKISADIKRAGTVDTLVMDSVNS